MKKNYISSVGFGLESFDIFSDLFQMKVVRNFKFGPFIIEIKNVGLSFENFLKFRNDLKKDSNFESNFRKISKLSKLSKFSGFSKFLLVSKFFGPLNKILILSNQRSKLEVPLES